MTFPKNSPIRVENGRSVSITGRSALDGGRVTLNGLGASRFFIVVGGSLTIEHLDLVNGSSPDPNGQCDPHYEVTRSCMRSLQTLVPVLYSVCHSSLSHIRSAKVVLFSSTTATGYPLAS